MFEAGNLSFGPVLFVDALYAFVFHLSERGWERQDAFPPSLCTAYEVPCVDFVGVFLRASASSWGN